MYTATMNYPVKQKSLEDFIRLWEEGILNLAAAQPGFVRMQLLTRDSEALAIGSWTDRSHAENFMSKGAFKKLMHGAKDMLSGNPKPTIWKLSAYAGA